MSRVISTLLSLAWALWFGGAVMVFLTAGSLFATFSGDRATAGTAAAGVFRTYERYQLVLAAVALVLTVAWRALPGAPKLKTAVFAFLAAATVAGVFSTLRVSPRLDALRREGWTMRHPEFRRLHGISNILYVSGAAALLGAGVLLPVTIRCDGRSGTDATGKPGTGEPDKVV